MYTFIIVRELFARLIIMYFLWLICNLLIYLLFYFLNFRNATLFNTVLIFDIYIYIYIYIHTHILTH